MRGFRSWSLPGLTALLTGLPVALPAFAESADERIHVLEQELARQQAAAAELQTTLRELQAELERLKGGSMTPAEQTDQAQQAAPAAEQSASAATASTAAPADGPSMEISGWANLDLIYDFDRVAPHYEETLVPTTIPTVPGLYGSDGNFIPSVKQTKLSFTSTGQTPLGAGSAWIEFDLFGTGSDAGETTFNLRHAWFELGGWGAGQTWSTFMDISTWPNVYDWWGPSAMALNRNVQLRYTFPQSGRDWQLALALEKQNGSFNVDPLDELAPTLADNVATKSELPDFIARWRLEKDWGHVQVAGVARRLDYETLNTPNNNPKGHEFGWGFNVTGILNGVGRDQIKYGVTFGEGIASFMNDGGGSNLALKADGDHVVAAESVGFLLYYDHYWSERWSSSIGFSQNDNRLTDLQTEGQPDKVSYASTNLFYTAAPSFVTGAELLYGKLENADGSDGTDVRIQFTTRYNFSNSFSAR